MRIPYAKSRMAVATGLLMLGSVASAQQLEEVIVTAQKKAENLQDVPISVSALQGERIQDASIPNMAAIADYVPNLHIAEASVNTNIYMRGIGSGNNRAFEQSVGMYIDGVYMGRGRQYRAGFLDLERVEVLRGPQGTLFGKNTVAGAINITTASPDIGGEVEGEINASFEENGGEIYEGFVQGSLSDTVAVRLAARYRETDGYIDNKFLNKKEGATEESGVRLTVAWQPSDTIDVNFKYSNLQRDRTGANSATWNYLTPAERDANVPNRSSFADSAYAVTDMFYPELNEISKQDFTTYKDNNLGTDGSTVGISFKEDGYDDTIQNFALSANFEFDSGTLTSVTGYSDYEIFDDVDVDWLPLQFIARADDHEYYQVSQEFRFTSDSDGPFNYTVGAYYDENELDMRGVVTIDTNFDGLFPLFVARANGLPDAAAPLMPQNLLDPLTGGAYSANQVSRNNEFVQGSESWAVFAQASYDISDTLSLTVGARYTEEDKDVVGNQYLGDSNCGLDGRADTSLPGCENGYSYFLYITQATSFNTYERRYTDERSTDNFAPSATLSWDMSDSSMLYITASEGFKSGGFSAADDGQPAGLAPGQIPPPGFIGTTPNEDFEFDDETVTSFEVGGKHELLDGAMRLNWAAFYSEYDDLQTAIFQGVGFSVKNAASSEVQGLEVDLQWQLTDALRIGGNGAYLDAVYGDFRDGPCTAIQIDQAAGVGESCGAPGSGQFNDLTGQPTLYSSEYSASLFADYRRPIGDLDFFGTVEYNYRGEFQSAGDNDPIDVIPEYEKVNLRFGLVGEYWEVMAYGRNIFDEAALQQSFDTPVLAGSHTYFMDEGRVLGVRGTFKF